MSTATVAFRSAHLGFDVVVQLGRDPEVSHYQFGSIGPTTWVESIRLAGVEISEHLRESVLDVVAAEAEAAYTAQCCLEEAC